QLTGQLSGKDLHAGDKVIAHFFNASGEVHSLQTELTIASEAQGKSSQWSYDLAEVINTAHHGSLRAGVKDGSGNINPIYGVNQVYAPQGSALQSVTLSYSESQEDDTAKESLSLSNVAATPIENGKATVTFNAAAKGEMHLIAIVSDHAGAEKGSLQQTIDNRSLPLSIPLTNVQAGHHMLRYSASNAQGAIISQGVINLMLEEKSEPTPAPAGNYDYTFPDNLKSYTAGTKVMQPKNGKVYQCRPFPYSGYCVQWSQHASQYEPGVGSDWAMAWTEVAQ
ncbi:MAG: N-acetylglucosamine-binding protein GbpA, partial [Escherichia sp.]